VARKRCEIVRWRITCGAVRYRQRAEQKLEDAGLESLTERETEVARLVADRQTKPEIATALVLSVKMIETHMHNIFRRLDVSSRVRVARAMDRLPRRP
jgi:DNA-binding NarL/FixJ family response regulator